MTVATLISTPRPSIKKVHIVVCLLYFAAGMSPIGALALSIFGVWTLPVGALVMVVPAILLSLVLGILYPAFGRLALRAFGMGLIAVAAYDGVRLPFILAGFWGDFIPKIGGWLLSQPEPNWILGYLWRYLGNGGGLGMAFTVLYAFLITRGGTERRSGLDRRVESEKQRRAQIERAVRGYIGTHEQKEQKRRELLQQMEAQLQPLRERRQARPDRRRPNRSAIAYGIAVWVCLLITLLATNNGQEMMFKLTPTSFVLSFIGHFVFGAVLGLLVKFWRPERELILRSATQPQFRVGLQIQARGCSSQLRSKMELV